jgi:uncharacterized protein (DUF2141 family)
MKNRSLLVTAFLILAYPGISDAALPSLTVHVRNALPPTGTVEVTLFNSEESFLKDIYLQQSGKANESGEFTVEFAGLEEGEYAVVVVHDENGNQLYDAGFMGFGSEGLGYSNNAWSWFGRPDFNEVKFIIDSEYTEIEIILD